MINHTSLFLNATENVMWQHINPSTPCRLVYLCFVGDKNTFSESEYEQWLESDRLSGFVCLYLSVFSKFGLMEGACFALSWREINAEINSS